MRRPSWEVVSWAAARIVVMHGEKSHPDRATGRCAMCPPEGECPMLRWATDTLSAGRVQ